MRLGLFWLGKLSREIELAIQFLTNDSSEKQFKNLIIFTQEVNSNTTLFVRETTKYPYETINDLQDAFHYAKKKDLDFAVISFGNGIPVFLDRLALFLASEPLHKSVFSFRVCRVVGAGFRHSPRFPLVDDHFIVLNVKRALETGFFDRKLVNASHFCEDGGRHAHLLSMIEYSLNPGKFHNHYVPDASRNFFGRICEFNPMPFHFCESTGFLTSYSQFKPALLGLLRLNLAASRRRQINWINNLLYFQRNELWYLRQTVNLDKIVNYIKYLFNTDKYQFQKKYYDSF